MCRLMNTILQWKFSLFSFFFCSRIKPIKFQMKMVRNLFKRKFSNKRNHIMSSTFLLLTSFQFDIPKTFHRFSCRNLTHSLSWIEIGFGQALSVDSNMVCGWECHKKNKKWFGLSYDDSKWMWKLWKGIWDIAMEWQCLNWICNCNFV